MSHTQKLLSVWVTKADSGGSCPSVRAAGFRTHEAMLVNLQRPKEESYLNLALQPLHLGFLGTGLMASLRPQAMPAYLRKGHNQAGTTLRCPSRKGSLFGSFARPWNAWYRRRSSGAQMPGAEPTALWNCESRRLEARFIKRRLDKTQSRVLLLQGPFGFMQSLLTVAHVKVQDMDLRRTRQHDQAPTL